MKSISMKEWNKIKANNYGKAEELRYRRAGFAIAFAVIFFTSLKLIFG